MTIASEDSLLAALASERLFGDLLVRAHREAGPVRVAAHWTQGEFHHDYVLELARPDVLPGAVLVVSTNCNAGVKEVLCLAAPPDRDGLWHLRCPANPEFRGPVPEVLARVRTAHWFDPCDLLRDDARSELRPEARRRQRGGGWIPVEP